MLDSGLARGPAARSFAAGVFVGAAALAAPLAAITLSPDPSEALSRSEGRYYPAGQATAAVVQGAVAGQAVGQAGKGQQPESLGPQGGTDRRDPIETAIAMKAVGASPEYLSSLRAVAPNLGRIDEDDLIALAATGVSPAYIRDLASSGFANLDADDIMQARALGITGGYIKGIRAAGGKNFSMEELVSMKAVGVTPGDLQRLNRAGYGRASAEQIVSFKAAGDPDHDPDPDHDVDHDTDPDPDYDPPNDDGS